MAAVALAVVVLAVLPRFVSDYRISLLISIFAYVAMATAWSFFSGTTRYISLATSAFVGIGVYAVTLSIDRVPLALGLALAALAGFLVALVVGLSTLRLRGVYFVIFTFGLAELIKQLVTWYEVNRNKNLMRLVFADVSNVFLYEALLAIAVVTVAASWLAGRTRLWRCREEACRVRTWTERAAGVRPRAVLTERARAEACRRVGKDATRWPRSRGPRGWLGDRDAGGG